MEELIGNIGRKIGVVTKTEVRYSGTFSSYNKEKASLVLTKVISHGTEQREASLFIPGSKQIYEYIALKLENIVRYKVKKEWIYLGEKRPIKDPLHKSITVPDTEYDFTKNSAELLKLKKHKKKRESSYDPARFYDALS
ncbi:hypothetical protein NEFER03_1877 [Nematocida sp. LUAm3]|nr:hypothetical protein NEFER03_1877 [Nematocida sp. LUAm3]KAI5173972.1 hypothetical protein NEFER02_0439 [Nematocida sp. LUAm2]KAI5177283.1 hypothetical protein NEFER01_0558 [Nematocida sp. LUAm1]